MYRYVSIGMTKEEKGIVRIYYSKLWKIDQTKEFTKIYKTITEK